MIINRPILHSFDIFDLIYLTSNCKYGSRLPPKIFIGLKRTLDKKNAEKMRSHMQKYVVYVRIYVNFWIHGIIFAYAILKMPLYAEQYAMCGFWQNICNHIFRYNQHP